MPQIANNCKGLKVSTGDVMIMRALRAHNPVVYTSGKVCRLFRITAGHTCKIFRGVAFPGEPFPIQPYASEMARDFIESRLRETP